MGFGRVSSQSLYCWFHGSSFEGFQLFFFVFWLPKLESSQKSNWTWCLDIFLRHNLQRWNRNNMSDKLHNTFWREKCSENQIWSCWNNSWYVEPTIMIIISTYDGNTEKVRSFEDCCLYKPTTILTSIATTIFYSINHVHQSFKLDVFYL